MIKLNGVEIKPTIFPDGTSQVWKIKESLFKPVSQVEWEFESEAEVMHIAQLAMLLANDKRVRTYSLDVPFLPYGRQDKDVQNDSTFALSTFLNIVGGLGFSVITTLDAHSLRIGNSLLIGEAVPEFMNIEPSEAINNAIRLTKPFFVCFPDYGANIRYHNLPVLKDLSSFSITKRREQSTGHIKSIFLNTIEDIEGESILLVDDLCDGGMTFKLVAEKLLTSGAKEVNLYTTHGIYSKGIQTLRDSGISRIFNRKGEVCD